jgi:putative membrane protein
MNWARLGEHELQKLANKIGEIEKHTSGELRLMIVRRSSVFGHVFPILFLILAELVYLVTTSGRLMMYEPPWLPYISVVLSVPLAYFLSHLDFLQRLLTSRGDQNQQVLARAEIEFYREGMGHTRSHTGILLMLSMQERQAVVLADKGISSKVPANTWDQVIALVIEGAKTNHLAEKLDAALEKCGGLLKSHFPQEAGDTNELPDAVIVKD